MFTITADELPIFMKCNGSRIMSPAPKVDTTDSAKARDEGTAAHYMAAMVFNNQFTIEELIDRKAPNGFYLTAEMAQHVGQYLAMLDCGEVEITTSFTLGNAQVMARADHISYRDGVLIVDDFKYGFRLVEPEEHWTLIAHALGYVIANQLQPTEIILRIHQPRPYHPDGKLREWRITYAQLFERYQILHDTLNNPSNILQSGPHCPKCHALGHCPAARMANMNAIDVISTPYVDDLGNDELACELDTLRAASATVEARLKAIESLAMHRLTTGQVIPDYAKEDQYAHRKWRPGFDGPTLTMLTGVDLNSPGTVTPAEAERRGVPEEVVKSLTTRPKIGEKLTRVSANKRAQRLLNK